MDYLCHALENRRLLSAWYVSAALGSDANPGTLGQPFLTIQQAANHAQPGDTVFIRAGVYRETVIPPNSGIPGSPIVFEPYQNESVTINGADPVAGWSGYQGSIYQTSMPSTLGAGQDQLFFDGQMMNEGRWPNSSLDPSHPTFSQVTSAQMLSNGGYGNISTATIGVSLTDPAGTWVGATIHISPGASWVTQTGTVTAYSPGSLTYQYQQLTDFEFPAAGNHFYLTGLFRTLDSAGEWYRDNNGNLYFWPPQNADPSGHSIEVKQRLYAFDLSGKSNIDIVGLNLFACTINTDAASTADRIEGINAQYISQQMNNPFPWGLQNLPQTTGIILNGTGNTIQNSAINYSSGNGIFLGGSNNSAQNCVVANTDYAAGEMAGIYILGANDQAIGNTVFNCGRSGIVDRVSGGAMILYNIVHDVGIQETDLGAIYTYGTDGQGARIAYNDLYNVHTGGYGAAGLYLDNDSANFIVDHNVVWNCDYALKMNPPCTNCLIYNNTLVATQYSVASSGNEAMTACVFANNIFTMPIQIGTAATQTHNLYNASTSQFVNAAAGNLQLLGTSSAIDAGMTIAPYTNGYLGAAPDAGAYEYGVPAFASGSTLPILSPPPAPSNPANLAAIVTLSTSVALSWSASGAAVTAYHLERGSDGVNFTDIADDIQTTTYLDSSAQPGVTYSYRVRAENAGVFSGYSNAAQVVLPLPLLNFVSVAGGVGGVTLRQDSDHRHIDWSMGATLAQLAINDAAGLSIVGDGANEPITLDYSNGNPLPNRLNLNGTFTISGLRGSDPLIGVSMNINRGTVFIAYAAPASDPIAAIRNYLRNGWNNGAWNGTASPTTGSISSAAAAQNAAQTTAIGYADSADGLIAGQPANTIELKYTLYGDTSLTGSVGFNDFTRVTQHYNQTTGGTWDTGDFNYDGSIDSQDITLMGRTYNTILASQASPAASAALTGSSAAESAPSTSTELKKRERDRANTRHGK